MPFYKPFERHLNAIWTPFERHLNANRSAEIVESFNQKASPRDQWPVVQWSEDESISCRCVTNEAASVMFLNIEQLLLNIDLYRCVANKALLHAIRASIALYSSNYSLIWTNLCLFLGPSLWFKGHCSILGILSIYGNNWSSGVYF